MLGSMFRARGESTFAPLGGSAADGRAITPGACRVADSLPAEPLFNPLPKPLARPLRPLFRQRPFELPVPLPLEAVPPPLVTGATGAREGLTMMVAGSELALVPAPADALP